MPFYGDSEYKSMYDPKTGIRPEGFNPKNEYIPHGKFDYSSTYNNEFKGI